MNDRWRKVSKLRNFKERIDAVIDYWDGDPNSDPASCYDYYEYNHSDEYMHLVDSDDENNYIDYDKGTITVNGKTYGKPNMWLLHKNGHVYLLVDEKKILIKWMHGYIGVPYIYP